ncbi:hypothetical protein C8R44DRAFT_736870 [Mycena epipterygia]|nr:hypothetical protein C8R44DRAFT_736870 [Mycena epipterygia]
MGRNRAAAGHGSEGDSNDTECLDGGEGSGGGRQAAEGLEWCKQKKNIYLACLVWAGMEQLQGTATSSVGGSNDMGCMADSGESSEMVGKQWRGWNGAGQKYLIGPPQSNLDDGWDVPSMWDICGTYHLWEVA